jgi:very-short-patch-repair endonuclease
MGMRCDEEILRMSGNQHGVVATWQLRALGLTSEQVRRLGSSTAWTALSTRVLARTGVPSTDDRAMMAAVLDASPGGAIAGTTAAAMWGVPGFRCHPIHVVRPKGLSRRPSTLAVVHEVVDLHPTQIKVMRGIPVISPGRVVCEMAASKPQRTERVLDWLWAERLLDGGTFHRTVGQLAGRGRKGSTFLRELDEARGPRYVPPASGVERRFTEICDFPMLRQVDVGGEEWCGRVDFKDPVLPLIVEIQSEKYHASLVDRAADAVRQERQRAAGFTVVEVWDHEVWHDPPIVRERIRKARWQLLQSLTRTGDGSSTDL